VKQQIITNNNEIDESAIFIQTGQTTGSVVRRPGVAGPQLASRVFHGLRQFVPDVGRAGPAQWPVQDGVDVTEPQPVDRWLGRHPAAG